MSEKPIEDRTEQRGYERHEFEPFRSSWAKPRCKVCYGFEDHRLHQVGHFCHCGRRLRPGERCDETYDGHKLPSGQAIAAEADARFFESVPD